MKITKEHYEYMKAAIEKVPVKPSDHRQWLLDNAKYTDINVRLAWDFCHAAGLTRFICENLYGYLNDIHITTALKSIIKELEEVTA